MKEAHALRHTLDNWGSMSVFERRAKLACLMHLHGETIEVSGFDCHDSAGRTYFSQAVRNGPVTVVRDMRVS